MQTVTNTSITASHAQKVALRALRSIPTARPVAARQEPAFSSKAKYAPLHEEWRMSAWWIQSRIASIHAPASEALRLQNSPAAALIRPFETPASELPRLHKELDILLTKLADTPPSRKTAARAQILAVWDVIKYGVVQPGEREARMLKTAVECLFPSKRRG